MPRSLDDFPSSRRSISAQRKSDDAWEMGTTMKLMTFTIVTLDGVMQGLGGPDEDCRGGFERGGWSAPLVDTEAMNYLVQVYQRADASCSADTPMRYSPDTGARSRIRMSTPLQAR